MIIPLFVVSRNVSVDTLFNHLVLASKFSLAPIVHIVKGTYATYELSNETMNIIMVAIEDT
jgi:hypothetical protein